MSEIAQFSALVADIHDASLEPSLWSGVLEKICAFVPAAVSHIFVQDGVTKRADVGFSCGLQAAWNELYLTKYVKINPLFPALSFCEAGEVFCGSNLLPAAQMAQTRFYREYLQPQGLGDVAGAVLEKCAIRVAAFVVILSRNPAPLDEKRLERIRLLVPHLQRAVGEGSEDRNALSALTFSELIARQYHLTPAELAVMFSMIEAGGAPEAADVLGLPSATVKTHLLSVLAKTGVRAETDLVRFVARLANPVAP
jgi:DNA-binding CsgD family transcriptional regulator